jgi:diaminopimelate epimerase
MWKPQDEEFFRLSSREELVRAKEKEKEKQHPEAVALSARESGIHGVQMLLMSFEVYESGSPDAKFLADMSKFYYDKAKNSEGSSGAMNGNMSIAYGVQALIERFSAGKRAIEPIAVTTKSGGRTFRLVEGI